MSIQFVHFSPEGVFLITEVPVVAGKENPVVKTLWKYIPAPGKESKVEGTTINPADLLPADRGFYRFPGSLTTPLCNEVVSWYLMKNPIEFIRGPDPGIHQALSQFGPAAAAPQWQARCRRPMREWQSRAKP
jgi:carbonic anhydrase